MSNSTVPLSTVLHAPPSLADVGDGARVTVVTSGHLSTCPRMLKVADSLADAGYAVRVVATLHEPWAAETDRRQGGETESAPLSTPHGRLKQQSSTPFICTLVVFLPLMGG